MRQNGRRHRPWRKTPTGDLSPTNAETVFQELQQRELRDLETCRLAWEHEGDPLALCAAVIHSPTLPEWLTNALLVQLTDGTGGYPALRAKAWRDRTRDAIDAVRAAEVAGARTHPEHPHTWEWSYLLGNEFAKKQYDDMPRTVSAAAAKFSYQRVCRGIQRPGRYYRAPERTAARIKQAWAYMLGLMEASLKTTTHQKRR